MNLPPTQQPQRPQNSEVLPSPGAVNDHPLRRPRRRLGEGVPVTVVRNSGREGKYFVLSPDLPPFVLSPEILPVDDAIFVLRDFVYLRALNFPRLIYDTMDLHFSYQT